MVGMSIIYDQLHTMHSCWQILICIGLYVKPGFLFTPIVNDRIYASVMSKTMSKTSKISVSIPSALICSVYAQNSR